MTPSAHNTFRWKIGFLLCMASALNYIYRSTLAILAPPMQVDLKWSDVEDGDITALFVLSYILMCATSRRIIDRIGTRKGFG